jgi:hypothetical protein
MQYKAVAAIVSVVARVIALVYIILSSLRGEQK